MNESGPRVAPLDAAAAKAAAAEAGIPEAMAELNVFRILLRHPQLARRVNDLLLTQLFSGHLDRRLRELIIMRIGWTTACDYEWTQHWRVAQQFGVEPQDLLAVRDWRSSDRFGATERAILAATDETLASGCVSAETWADCERALPSAEERLELVSAISTWHFISEMAKTLQIPLEQGVASWPPEGEKPTGAS